MGTIAAPTKSVSRIRNLFAPASRSSHNGPYTSDIYRD